MAARFPLAMHNLELTGPKGYCLRYCGFEVVAACSGVVERVWVEGLAAVLGLGRIGKVLRGDVHPTQAPESLGHERLTARVFLEQEHIQVLICAH